MGLVPIERRSSLAADRHVGRIVPRAADDVVKLPGRVPDPFLDVACEAVGAVGAEVLQPRDWFGRLAVEIPRRRDLLAEEHASDRLPPVKDGRQPLARERRIRRRLVPADAADRVVGLSVWKRAELPAGRAGPAGLVAEALDEVEGAIPVLRLLVASGIDEPFVFAIGDFVLVQPEVRQLDRRRAIFGSILPGRTPFRPAPLRPGEW